MGSGIEMRYVGIALIPLAIVLIASFTLDPEGLFRLFDRSVRAVQKNVSDPLLKKELHFKGLDLITQAELEKLLPLEDSVVWWRANQTELVARLKSHPMVENVTVQSCKDGSALAFGCFEIAIKERAPAFIALVESKPWLVGEDGGFLGPLPESIDVRTLVNELEPRIGRLRVLKGVSTLNSSPDLTRARFEYAKRALDLIEQVTEYGVEWGELRASGELSVKFLRFPFEATFAFKDDSWDVLRDECKRLKSLLVEFGPKVSEIKGIDLAYDTLAVVKFRESAEQGKNPPK